MNKTKSFSRSLSLLILLGLSVVTVCAQTQPSPRMLAANELMKAQKWSDAAKAFEEIVKDEPGNARAWYQLAMSRMSLKQTEPAIEAFQKNIAISGNPNAMYNLACAYARLGQKEKTLEWLDKAVNSQNPPIANMAEDPDLADLRGDARFKELVTVLDKKRRPCMYSAESKQFDFWIGEWDVFNVQGQQTGTNVIERISGGCGVLENWRDVFGGEGKSVNFYDPATTKWYQYWIGADGTPQRFSGSYKEGAMRYEGEPATGATLRRMSFFNLDANTVRQFAEQSVDGGKTWTVTYDFKYVRKK